MGQELFAAVVTTTLFALSAATGGSAANSCRASLPPLVGGGGVCPVSADFVNGLRSNVSALLQSVHCMLLGHTPEYRANSCTELAEREPDSYLLRKLLHGSSNPHSHQSKCSVKWVSVGCTLQWTLSTTPVHALKCPHAFDMRTYIMFRIFCSFAQSLSDTFIAQ